VLRCVERIVMSSSQGVPIGWMLAAIVSVTQPATVIGDNLEGPPHRSGLRVVATEGAALVLDFELSDLETGFGIVDGRTCRQVSVAGLVNVGNPPLPVNGTLLGIPPGSLPSVTVLEFETTTVPSAIGVCPSAQPFPGVYPTAHAPSTVQSALRTPGVDGGGRLVPETPVELVRAGLLRNQEVAALRIRPVQYDPITLDLVVHTRLRIRVDFELDHRSDARIDHHDEGPFEEILRSSTLNYDQARRWRVGRPAAVTAHNVKSDPPPGRFKILVDRDGLYRLTHAQLDAAGVPVDSEDPRTFKLCNRGSEVAVLIPGEADGSFDPGDELLFYGEKTHSRHTDVNVYWLDWDGAAGLRMQPVDGTPGGAPVVTDFLATHSLEEDHAYQSGLPSGADDDRWYWDYLMATTGLTDEIDLFATLVGLSTVPGRTATVRGLLRGYNANPQHHTQVVLNGHLVDDATFSPTAEHSFEIDVPQDTHLLEGVNTLTVRTIADGGIAHSVVYLNWFEIDSHRVYVADDDVLFCEGGADGVWRYEIGGFATGDLEVFDITDPGLPTQILNFAVVPDDGLFRLSFEHGVSERHRYLVQSTANRLDPMAIVENQPSDLHSPLNGADYIVITHADFAADVQPLADHRALEGLRTRVVDVEDVYDEFSGGVFEPQAVTDFLAHAYANWQAPAPSFVLLVGDGHYDPKDNLARGETVWLPPYLADVDPWMGETAADNRFVTVSGGDILPDMHIGRLPCRTPAEAAEMVAKIIAYEQDDSAHGWTWRSLFVADNADLEGDFAELSDTLIDQSFPTLNEAHRVYLGVTHADVGAARTAILSTIDRGCLLVSYFGHATHPRWAQENLLDIPAIGSLANGDRLPVMVPMTSLEGYFVHPSPIASDLSCLAESIVRATGRGAVASWSPTGLAVAAGHDTLVQGLFEAVFVGGMRRLGDATTQAKIHLYATDGAHLNLIDTYTLFGDPALALQVADELVFADGFETADVSHWSESAP
jgi:hypothetical protein